MTLLALVVLACAASTAISVRTCKSNRAEALVQFNERKQDVRFPCKFFAVKRQTCGKYRVNVVPGNIWHYPKYQLDTIWMDVTNTETDDYWEGRTTNKKAVKYFNSQYGATELFVKKDGNMATEDNFQFGREDGTGVYLKDAEDTFRVTFTPWDPNNRTYYPNSEWKFECFSDDVTLVEYPLQMCGGDGLKVKDRVAEGLGMPEKFREVGIYYDTFTDTTIVQGNPLCTEATDILSGTCQTDEQRLAAIVNCKSIIHGQKQAECITNYACDPMVVFNACLKWGCTGDGFDPANKDLCATAAEGIDFCPRIKQGGNLTERVIAAKCYTDYIPMEEHTDDHDEEDD